MPRYIIVSFLALCWAFYELSGGSDFQPRVAAVPEEAADETQDIVATETAAPARAAVAKPAQIEAADLVARPAVVNASAAAPEPVVATATAPEPKPLVQSDELQRARTSLSQGLSLVPQTAPGQRLTLASLGDGAAGLTTIEPANEAEPELITANVTEPEPVAPDIREVTGTRVNMRDGPGTIYPVVARLAIGHQVEVLSESGTGWLRLRSVTSKKVGWIAASLVSRKPR